MAAADLDGDGRIEVVATTTNTSDSGSQVFVFTANGANAPGWPRYSAADATFNGVGNHGYGAYGENVGIGNLDDDPQLEIVVTFDNHQINVFNHDGTSLLASPWFTNRQNDHLGARLGWGQFIRWLKPKVEDDHYHRHAGDWPDVNKTPWLQWTASPPSIGFSGWRKLWMAMLRGRSWQRSHSQLCSSSLCCGSRLAALRNAA